MRITRSFAVLALLGIGCGSSNSNPDGAGSNSEASAPTEAGATTGDDLAIQTVGDDGGASANFCTSKPALASATNLSGVWVAKLTGAQVVQSTITVHNKNVYYQLVTVRQTGNDVAIQGRYCDRVAINAAGARVPVIIPEAWAHTETPISRSGTFAPRAGGYSVLTLPALVEVIGAQLPTPTSPLPTDANDPAVVDEDKDGHPGITISLGGFLGGSIYSDQSQTTAIEAIAVATDRLEGVMTFASSQNILGASSPTIVTAYSGAKTLADPAVCSSNFVMVKVADVSDVDGGFVDGGGGIDCAWVRANETTLFP